MWLASLFWNELSQQQEFMQTTMGQILNLGWEAQSIAFDGTVERAERVKMT